MRGLPAGLAAGGEFVLIGAADIEIGGDIIGGLRHRIGAVLRLHLRVHEAPADGRIINRIGAAEGGFGLGHDERRPRHRLDAAGNDHVAIAGPDRTRGHADRIHAGAAEPVHRRPRQAGGQPGQQCRHASDIAIILARLIGAAIDEVVDAGPVHTRIARHQRRQRHRRQIVGANGAERAAVATDRSPDCVADIGLGHVSPLHDRSARQTLTDRSVIYTPIRRSRK